MNKLVTSRSILIRITYLLISISVVYFAFLPVISIVSSSLFVKGQLAISIDDISRALYYLKRSLAVSLLVTALATVSGFIIAFTLNRLRFRGRRLLSIIALFPLINPPFVGSISFIMLFGKRGLITHTLLGLTVSPFGWQGVVTMQVLGLTTLAYILISSAVQRLDPSLEEAARNLGIPEGRIFKTVTLPLMIPELTSTALLVFLASMADFGTPLIIGGDFQTLASDLYIQITGLYDMRRAAISGAFLLLPCLLAFVLQRYYLGRKSYFTNNVTFKNVEYRHVSPLVRYSLISFTSLFIGFICLKYGFIIVGSLTKQWGYNYTFTWEHFSLVLKKDLTPFLNSVKLATVVAFVSSFVGVFLSYLIQRRNMIASAAVDLMATLPAAVPGILFGIGYLVTFRYPLFGIGKWIMPGHKPLVLLGSGIIIYLICVARYLNVGLRSGYALLMHTNPNLEQASFNLGASETRTFAKVTLPQLKPAIVASFFKVFSTTMTTLGAIIFLLLPSNKVAVQQIFQTVTSSSIGDAAAMAILLSSTSLVLLGGFYLLFNVREVYNKVKKLPRGE